MKNSKFSFVIVVVLFLLACKKEQVAPTSYLMRLQTIMYDQGDLNPIPNNQLFIYKGTQDSLGDFIASFSANSKGEIDTVIRLLSGVSYTHVFKHPLYYDIHESASTVTPLAGNDPNAILQSFISSKMYPKAWVKLNIKNTSPYDFSDELLISFADIAKPERLIKYKLKGVNIDTAIVVPVKGSAINVFRYDILKEGKSKGYSKDLTSQVLIFDTVDYELNY